MKKIILLVLAFFALGTIDLQAHNDPWYYNTPRSNRSNRRGYRTTTRRDYRRRSCNSRSYRSYLYDRYNYVAYDCNYCTSCEYCNYCPFNNYCNCDYYPSWSFSVGGGPRSVSYYY